MNFITGCAVVLQLFSRLHTATINIAVRLVLRGKGVEDGLGGYVRLCARVCVCT